MCYFDVSSVSSSAYIEPVTQLFLCAFQHMLRHCCFQLSYFSAVVATSLLRRILCPIHTRQSSSSHPLFRRVVSHSVTDAQHYRNVRVRNLARRCSQHVPQDVGKSHFQHVQIHVTLCCFSYEEIRTFNFCACECIPYIHLGISPLLGGLEPTIQKLCLFTITQSSCSSSLYTFKASVANGFHIEIIQARHIHTNTHTHIVICKATVWFVVISYGKGKSYR